MQKAIWCEILELLLTSQYTDVNCYRYYKSSMLYETTLWPGLWWVFFSGQVRMKFGLKMKTLDLKPDSCITHTLAQSYMYVIVVVFPSLRALCEVWTHCPLLYEDTVFVCHYTFGAFHHWVQISFGWVHYCTKECLSMINKGLHFSPSSLILLFLVAVWWAKGLELQRPCTLFPSFTFFTSWLLRLPNCMASRVVACRRLCFKMKVGLT